MTALMLNTGFQSSRRMLRHMFPSRSMLGWYTLVRHFTLGASCGYCGEMQNENRNKPPVKTQLYWYHAPLIMSSINAYMKSCRHSLSDELIKKKSSKEWKRTCNKWIIISELLHTQVIKVIVIIVKIKIKIKIIVIIIAILFHYYYCYDYYYYCNDVPL